MHPCFPVAFVRSIARAPSDNPVDELETCRIEALVSVPTLNRVNKDEVTEEEKEEAVVLQQERQEQGDEDEEDEEEQEEEGDVSLVNCFH